MIPKSSLYANRTASSVKKPVYYFQLGPVDDGSIVPAIEQEYSTGPIVGATKSRKVWMDSPTGSSNSISVLGGTSTVGDIQVPLVDQNGEITKLVTKYQRTWKNRICTLMGGYDDIPESQFIPVFKGVVNNIAVGSDPCNWTFTVSDFTRFTKTTGFAADTILAIAIVETDMSIQVVDFSAFATQTMWGDRGAVNYIRVDDEIMSYTVPPQTAGATYTTVTITERGLFSSTISTHDVNADVKNFIVLDGNPLDILLWLYTSDTGDGSNGKYDVLPSGQGAAILPEYVDVTGIESQRDRFLSGYRMQIFIEDSQDIKSLVETEILRVINAYPVIKNDGRLSVKLYTVPYAVDVVSSFDDSNIVNPPSFDLNMVSQGSFYNIVKIQYDYDIIADQYNTTDVYINDPSLALSGEQATLTVTSKGLRSGEVMGGKKLAKRYAQQVFQRFAYGCPTLTVKTDYSQHLVEVGDFVNAKSEWIPDLYTGARNGTSVICEVTNKQIDFKSGQVSFTLQATGFLSKKRYGVITPIGYPVYTSATDKQKKRGFVSKRLSDTAGVMSNGDDGYYISP